MNAIWAKYNAETGNIHPLIAHMVSVGETFSLLWDSQPFKQKHSLIAETGLNEKNAKALLTALAALHDIGKAVPHFQHLQKSIAPHLEEIGLKSIKQSRKDRIHHGFASSLILGLFFKEKLSLDDSFQLPLRLIGYHHSRFRSLRQGLRDRKAGSYKINKKLGGHSWREVQFSLVNKVFDIYGVKWESIQAGLTQSYSSPSWILFLGLLTQADWIASMAEPWKKDPEESIEAYQHRTRKVLKETLEELDMLQPPQMPVLSFKELFSFDTPRPMQQRLIDLSGDISQDTAPRLTIVEGPTGEGKTEGAFMLAQALQKHSEHSGIYIGMPTQAMSNALFERFKNDFLQPLSVAADQDLQLRLVHGNASLNDQQAALIHRWHKHSYTYGNDDIHTEVITNPWFMPSKRSLLARYGVGTIDQALMGSIWVKHFYLRLLGLAGKTLILDEVHAYDLFMKKLLDRLLLWLKALGTDVILLSATLPLERSRELLELWKGDKIEENEFSDNYPLIQSIQADSNTTLWGTSFQTRRNETIKVKFSSDDIDDSEAIEEVIAAHQEGATVGIILNTVSRAQRCFQRLRDELETPDNVYLFHARYPHYQRSQIENEVINRFSKRSEADKSAILVATQVAEQSLDLDFDLLVSDLAPIDLLIQRAGRLQRHDLPFRPEPFASCRQIIVLINDEKQTDSSLLPDLSSVGGGYVYDKHLMWKTWWRLRQKPTLRLPEEMRDWLESVYSAEDPKWLSYWKNVQKEWSETDNERWKKEMPARINSTRVSEDRAELVHIPPPSDMATFDTYDGLLFEDEDPSVSEDYKARTRLGEPTLNLVVMFHKDGVWYLNYNSETPLVFKDDFSLTKKELKHWMQAEVKLRSRWFDTELLEATDNVPEFWTMLKAQNRVLGYHFPLIFDLNTGAWLNGEGQPVHLSYNKHLGIVKESTT